MTYNSSEMPLTCLRDNVEIHSFEIDDLDIWNALVEENKSRKNFLMPCCGSKVVLKRSKRDVPFFAHYAKSECTSKSETVEHISAKTLIAKAALAAGWNVTTEKKGKNPDGQEWIADVYAYRGEIAIAIEVQWSHQTNEVTIVRQARYNSSKVRSLWLFRQSTFKSSKFVPGFRLVFDNSRNTFTVQIKTGDYCHQAIELSAFIRGALNRALVFAPVRNHQLPLEVYGGETLCFICKKSTKIITDMRIAARRRFAEFGNWDVTLTQFANREELISAIPDLAHLASFKIGELRNSNLEGITNTCFHCGENIVRHLNVPLLPSNMLFEASIKITDETLGAPALSYGVNYWWFDESKT